MYGAQETEFLSKYFYLFLIIALIFFIIDPFLKAQLPSVKANLLLIEIYVFFVHFAITFAGSENTAIFFFLYIIPIISAAMSFGIRGSVLTTLAIFFLYNLTPDRTTKSISFFGPQVQDDLPKFIALMIIAIMLGFSNEENRKTELRAYERMSKMLTLNEIKNSLRIDNELTDIISSITNAIMRIMNYNSAVGVLIEKKTNQIIEKQEIEISIDNFKSEILKRNEAPIILTAKQKIFNEQHSKKIYNIIKMNVDIDESYYITVILSRLNDKNPINISDIELLKSLKIYIDLLFKNRALYKRIEYMHNYMYFTFKNLPLGIILLDKDLRITFMNTQALLLLKYDNLEELKGKKLGVNVYFFPDNKIVEKIEKEEYMLFHKTQLVAKNLEVRQIELTTTKLSSEFDSFLEGTIISFIDITEMKEMEDELSRRDKLASLGQMAAGLAHEFRNPLGAIEGFASLLHQDLQKQGDIEKTKIAEKVLEGVHSLNKIVTEFLNFTNKIQLKKENKNILETLDKTLLFIRKSLEQNKITVEKNYTILRATVLYDEDKIKQVFLNIILNAIDALQDIENPLLRITVKLKDILPSQPNTMICIEIFNNGGNIDETIKNKLFNPFFTTKANGIGLGLTISQKIIEEHFGRIYFKNEKNGVKFVIELPVDRRLVSL